MVKCNIYKIKEVVKEKLIVLSDFYYADDFYKDLVSGKLYITMIGVNLETMEMAQLFDKFIVPSELFSEYFYDDIIMTTHEINNKIEELSK